MLKFECKCSRNILCFPIKDGEDILGVAELCNKGNGPCFSSVDEELATSFSIYCGISLVHGLMYKKVRDAQHRSHLSNELMMYHMKVIHISSKLSRNCAFHPMVVINSEL